MFDAHVRRPLQQAALSDDEKAAQLVDAFRTLLPTVTTLVAHHFRSVLLEVAQEHLEAVGDPTELAAASPSSPAVGPRVSTMAPATTHFLRANASGSQSRRCSTAIAPRATTA